MTSRLTFTAGNHSYYLADNGRKRRLPSVTTMLNQLAKPALVKWAARVAADYACDNWADLAAMPPSERNRRIAAAADMARNTAAAKGTQIHVWAQQLLAGEPVSIPEEYTGSVEGLARWWERSGYTPFATEVMVWSDDDDLAGCGYAGTVDVLAEKGGRLHILDWKSGSGVWPEAAIQVAGYAAADNWVIDGHDKPAVPVAGLAIGHIRPDGTTLHVLDPEQRRLAEMRWAILRELRSVDEPTFREAV